MGRFRVHSYNLLAPRFARSKYFVRCYEGYLTPSYRLDAIKKKLTDSINQGAIVCLQELPPMWEEELRNLFHEHNFEWINTIHSPLLEKYQRDTIMGVAIAFPKSQFSLRSSDIVQVSASKGLELVSPWNSYVERLLLRDKKPMPPWTLVRSRKNKMVILELEHQNQQKLVVGTYHMPCLYQTPPVMVIHAALCAQEIQRTAQNTPYVLCGDFNIKPGSPTYELLTTGRLSPDHPDYPPSLPRDPWSPTLYEGMGSAYMDVEKKEPDYTNFPGINVFFRETLDYLFYSKRHLRAVDVIPLPTNAQSRILPSITEPSDHLLIGASFDFVDKE